MNYFSKGDKMNLSPIVLIVYNRPSHTKKTIDALLNNKYASQSNLFVFSDNAYLKNDQQKVQEVRSYIKSIRGFKKITLIERERNWGMVNNIIDAVTKIVFQYEKVIVVEDDVLVHHYFLQYMNESLELYIHDNLVCGISGYLDPVKDMSQLKENTFFHQYPSCWGWGTWKRAWLKFDINLKTQIDLINKHQELNFFSFNSAHMILDQVNKNLSGNDFTYQIRWYASCFNHRGIFLHPAKSLTTNIGFDGSGERCGTDNKNITQEFYNGNEIILKKIPLSEQISIRKKYECFYNNLTNEHIHIRRMKDILKTIFNKGKKTLFFSTRIMKKIKKELFHFLLHVIPSNQLISIVRKKIYNKKIILAYHSFGMDSYSYCLSNDCFSKHLELLKQLNIKFCCTKEFLVDDNQAKVLITFDDGYKSALGAIETLLSNSVNAVLFITTSFNESGYQSYMTWNDLKRLSKNKLIEIGSHCVHHVSLDGLNLYDVEQELLVSKDTLQNQINSDINILAYPYGNYNTEIKMLAKKYYDYAFTSVESINNKTKSTDPYSIMRLCLDKSHEWEKKFLLDIYLNACD